MKRSFCIFLLIILLLCGCNNAKKVVAPKEHFIIEGSRTYVAPFGDVPSEFKTAMDNEILRNARIVNDRIFSVESLSNGYRVSVYDLNFMQLATWQSDEFSPDHYSPEHYRITELLPCSDGGFLIAAQMDDHYILPDKKWASEYGYRTMLIKCDEAGNEEYRYSEDLSWQIVSLYETDTEYLVFSEVETPDTQVLGVCSPTDVYLLALNKDGSVKDSRTLGSSDYDCLRFSAQEDDNYLLYTYNQEGASVSGYHKITVTNTLEVIDDELLPTLPKRSVGLIDGKPQYNGEGIFAGYQDGTIEAVADYGDFYFVISRHITGTYEKQPPSFSATWYYQELVYSAFDKDGNALWIATEDVSPDYDAMRELFVT